MTKSKLTIAMREDVGEPDIVLYGPYSYMKWAMERIKEAKENDTECHRILGLTIDYEESSEKAFLVNPRMVEDVSVEELGVLE